MGRAIRGCLSSVIGLGQPGRTRPALPVLALALALAFAAIAFARSAVAAGVIFDPCLSDTLGVDAALGNSPLQISSGAISHACETVGITGVGEIDQSGATNTVTSGPLTLADQTGSTGTYRLLGGTLSVPNIATGGGGSLLDIDGGTLDFATSLSVGFLFVGSNTTGSLTVGSGQSVSAALLEMGEGPSSSGSVAMFSGSSVSASSLKLALSTGSIATLSVNGGNFAASSATVGAGGDGNFAQSGGAVTVSGQLSLADGFNSGSGSYGLHGGTLTAGSELIGNTSQGTFVQTGGTNTVTTGPLTLGGQSYKTGTYDLAGGTLNVSNIATGSGFGVLYIDGGTLNFGTSVAVQDIRISENEAGSLTIGSGQSVDTTSLEVGVAPAQTGLFTMDAGSNVSATTLSVAAGIGSQGIFTLDGGNLTTDGVIVGDNGDGLFLQNGGTLLLPAGHSIRVTTLVLGSVAGAHGSYTQSSGNVDVTGDLDLGNATSATGAYILQGGTLDVGGSILAGPGTGTLNLDGGTLSFGNGVDVSTLNLGSSALATGSLSVGAGSVSATDLNVGLDGAGLLQQTGGTMDAANLVIAADPGSAGSFTLSGGALSAGALTNNGSFDFSGGTLDLSGPFTNHGSYDQAGGILALPSGASHANTGTMQLDAASQLRVLGAFTNQGTLMLGGGQASGTALLQNDASGKLEGAGSISGPFANAGLILPGSGTLQVGQAFSNSGAIELSGPASGLQGGAISNSGTIQGAGVVTNDVANGGTVEALGGTLTLSGAVTNSAAGLLAADTGSKLLVTHGLAQNQGVLSLTGGIFDNNGQGLTNAGQIPGFGTLRTGGLTNQSQMLLGNGLATVNGAVTNQAGARMQVANGSAVFSGAVDNQGTFEATSATVAFTGGFTNGGVYISDPSTQSFGALMIAPTGYLLGGAGDVFQVSSSFTNQSQENSLWNTDAASLVFDGGSSEAVVLAGLDEGASSSGYHQNFSWGNVELKHGTGLDIANAPGTAAWYVRAFTLDDGLSQIASITSDVNIYYDPGVAGNTYLGGKTYALQGGGLLMPVPEPPVEALLALGLAGLAWYGRRGRIRG